MDWARIQPLFDWDGSLRDICIPGTTAEDWRKALDAIRRHCSKADMRTDGSVEHVEGIPDPAPDILDLIGVGALLVIDLGGIQVNCHFFDDQEIEFDIDPREITGLDKVERLLGFMATLSEATGKPVRLTPENGRDFVLCQWDAGTVTWASPDSNGR